MNVGVKFLCFHVSNFHFLPVKLGINGLVDWPHTGGTILEGRVHAPQLPRLEYHGSFFCRVCV